MSAAPLLRKAKELNRAAAPATARESGNCDHCGDSLAGLKVVRRRFFGAPRELAFCCLGCAFIAEQLQLARASNRDFAALEASVPPTAPRAGGGARLQIRVQGMVCAACASLIEHRLRREPGVIAAHVDFAMHRAYVTFDAQRSTPAEIARAVERSGYRAGSNEAEDKRAARIDLLRLLIAWLAMMQVMMLAVPTYFAARGDIATDIEQLLRIAQLILTVPVVSFSGWPLLRAAASQLRAGQVGMDLPIVLGLSAAFGASVWAVLTASGPVYFDSIAMFVALVLGARWLQAKALRRAAEHIEAAEKRTPSAAQRLRSFPASGAIDSIAADELKPGDHVLVAPGGSVPADGIVVRGASTISQAWLTGEATPIDKSEADPVLAGSVNFDQPLVIEVTRAGAATSLAALRRLVDDAGRERPRIVELANRVAAVFLWAVIVLTVATACAWLAIDPALALPNTIALLVATCPCALSLAAPAALAATQSALARRGVLTARAAALQPARVNVVAVDKTGTPTSAQPSVVRVLLLRDRPLHRIIGIAAGLETLSMHPYARALAAYAVAARVEPLAIADVRVEGSAGVEATVDGERYRLGRVEYAQALTLTGFTDSWMRLADLLDAHGLDDTGLAVLADRRGPLAIFVFAELPRRDAAAFADHVRANGAELILLSGDRRAPVEHIARELHIDNGFANQTPESKRQRIAQLQREGRIVAMIGDGMNDAPVLAQADVSIALAEGAALAQARADFIVTSSRLVDAAAVFDAARRGMRIVRQNLAWALVYNGIAIPLAAFGFLTPALAAAGMAASSLIVVGNALRARRIPLRAT
jgi:P-type Cu2+ transporter